MYPDPAPGWLVWFWVSVLYAAIYAKMGEEQGDGLFAWVYAVVCSFVACGFTLLYLGIKKEAAIGLPLMIFLCWLRIRYLKEEAALKNQWPLQ
jgi:cytochrome c biogenesis factor